MSQAAADALFSEGNELFRSERFGEAASRYERAVHVFPHHARGWKGLGQSLLLMGKPHEAARAFDQAIGLSPGSATALWGGAVAHAEIGNKIVAHDYLRRSIALQPSWVALAAQTPQFASLLTTSARAAELLQGALGPFSTARYHHAADPARVIAIGRLPNIPDDGRFTYVTVGLSDVDWNEPERPRIELIMASAIDTEACPEILANLAFHLVDTGFYPVPGTLVRDVISVIGASELATRLPHVYVAAPRLWGVELPLEVGPPAITLAQVFPVRDDEVEHLAGIDVTDLAR